jgi:spermidine synthase
MSLFDRFRFRVERPVASQIHDNGDSRVLRFNNGVMQSAMHVSDPDALALSYTLAMMGFLLFQPAPREVLLVGLGGGSLVKFIYHTLPDIRITALEIDPEVIALRDEFRIPPDDERLRIIEADGGEYLARDDVRADVILLDAYDAIGLPEALCSESFYSHCRRALGASGVLAANLWGGEPKRLLYLERLRRVFDDRAWWCRPRDSSALVVFAAGAQLPAPEWPPMQAAARALDQGWGLDLASLIDDLRTRPLVDS